MECVGFDTDFSMKLSCVDVPGKHCTGLEQVLSLAASCSHSRLCVEGLASYFHLALLEVLPLRLHWSSTLLQRAFVRHPNLQGNRRKLLG
jgi:hypothetical protein